MRKLDKLNPLAREMAEALLAKYPAFALRFTVLEHGGFQMELRAPRGSKVYGICVSRLEGETW